MILSEFNYLYKKLQQYFQIAQEVRTQSHTNPKIIDSRRYRYVIFDSRALTWIRFKNNSTIKC